MRAGVVIYFAMFRACALQQTGSHDRQACDVCRCHAVSQGKRVVDCQSRKVLSVPSRIPITTTLLRLQNNRLTWLQPGTFQTLVNLESLDLQRNQLHRIDPGAFDGLTALTNLDISQNKLTSLPAGVFVSLASLRVLRVQQNEILQVEVETLAGLEMLEHLEHVRLDHNLITHLPCEHLDVLPTRVFLHLSGNPLHCDCLDVIAHPPCLTRANLTAQCTTPRLLTGQTAGSLQGTCTMLFWSFLVCALSLFIFGFSVMYVFSRRTKRAMCNLYNCKFRFVHPRRARPAWQ